MIQIRQSNDISGRILSECEDKITIVKNFTSDVKVSGSICSFNEIAAVDNFTLGIWKCQVQFEASTKIITSYNNLRNFYTQSVNVSDSI